LYDYSLPNGLPSGSRAAWSHWPLRTLSRGPLTPFSYSVLAEIAGRAWYAYFDTLGFDPMPRARVLRQYEGRPYLNLTISAQRDVEGAAVEPPTLRVNGQPFPICKWEKPGLIAGLKFSLAQNKIDQLLKSLVGEISAITQQAQTWDEKTREMRWTQAEVLQIMEEIEKAGTRSFMAWLAARHQLDLAYNRLIRLSADRAGYPANLALLGAAIGDEAGPVEQALLDELARLGERFAADAGALGWLQAGEWAAWSQTLPNPTLVTALQTFLATYGHRCVDEAEIRHARWVENPTPIWQAIRAAAHGESPLPAPRPSQPQALLDAIENNRRKEAQGWLQKIPALRGLQSQAQHAFAHILAGARRWALAAGRDAMVDQRLLALDDVFFYELEEMKEMMTGEWNVSSRSEIQSTARKRRADYGRWQATTPADLLIGESEAQPTAGAAPTALAPSLADWLGRF
jgi:rifampicin phosphotransferase